MSQTDRQTDKATHWKSAIFDCSGQFQLLEQLPAFVKEVHRQKEICPTTGKEHYQVHVVCHRQVRLSQLTGWIRQTKWMPVFGEQHIKNSIAYCSKKDTAVEGTQQVLHGQKYLQLHELLLEIAKFSEPDQGDINDWPRITSRMLLQDLTWANKLSNPALRRMWQDWRYVFITKVSEACEDTSGSFIIEEPPTGSSDEGGEPAEDFID